jgi:rhamnosyltransferase
MPPGIQAAQYGNSPTRPPKCLVLLASYNGAAYIQDQLTSILAQRNVDVTLLIGDDGSSDETLQIAKKCASAENVHLKRREVGSGSAAQNFVRLIRETDIGDHQYIALSDQDDIWLPDKLQTAVTSLAEAGASGYSCSVIAYWPDGRKRPLCQSPNLRAADFLFEGAGQGCTFVITAELFKLVQHTFSECDKLTAQLIYHDWAIYAIARAAGANWVFDPRPFVMYRQHSANDTGARYSASGIRKRLKTFQNHGYARQVNAVAQLCMKVSPTSPRLCEWLELTSGRPSLQTRLRKASYCLKHGRRRTTDRVITAIATAMGWF